VPLTNAQRQRIERIARGRADEPLRVLEGPKAVRDALAWGAVREVWTRRGLDPTLRQELEEAAREGGVPIGEGSAGDFDRLGRTVTPQGVVALVRDTGTSVDEVLARPGMLIWLDGVQDPGNVGAVVRVAAAFAAAGILVGEGSADPLGLKALRASAGLALRVPFARGAPAAFAEGLRERGRPAWLLDPSGDDLFRLRSAPKDLALLVGGEGRGPSEVGRAAAARSVGIPLAPGVDSLNAAVAAGIAVAVLSRLAG
jgi:TrmH family RNA methyltransferase